MNLTFNQLNGPAAQAKSVAPAAAPATADAPAPLAIGETGAADGRQPAADDTLGASVSPALAFAQWLGLEQIQIAPVAAEGAEGADSAGDAAAAALNGLAPGLDAAVEEQQPNADTPLLGAMAMGIPMMPLMPSTQATLAAVFGAMSGGPAAKEPAPAVDADLPSLPGAAAPRADAALPMAAASGPAPAPAPASSAAALPAETLASNADAPQDQAAPSIERGAANTTGIAAPAPGNAQRTADTVTLSGPPTAWRQTLQEALGDRLQLQLGKNAEQAVIRLDPPMLGRVEIAIRHSAGSLEVHISATHGEVLRQLQTVGESLRNDLAQRQFTDVAVNITAAPRGAAAGTNNMFAGDGSGRGRQQEDRQEEQNPGNALAEANTGAASFSLNAPGNRRATT